MSKIREQFDRPPESPLTVSPTGDLRPFVVFTQLRKSGPHIYAGWLEAADADMAMNFAKEHYGQDQECVGIWAIERMHITSSDGLYGFPSPTGRGDSRFAILTQKRAGDLFLAAGSVDADSPQRAIEEARKSNRMAQGAHCIWVVAMSHIRKSADDDLIWRHTDQSYRLARGYGREVRAKWIAFRDEKKLAEYEKDDLAEAF